MVGVGVGGSGVLVGASVGVEEAAAVGGTSVGTAPGGVEVETGGRKSAVRVRSGVGADSAPARGKGEVAASQDGSQQQKG